MERLIKKAEAVYLSDDDIQLITRGECPLVDFSNLRGVNDLMEAFTEQDCFILFYGTESADKGHFSTVLLHRDTKVLEHWDSYGYTLEKLYQISDWERKTNKFNIILDLSNSMCVKYGLQFQENRTKLQKLRDGVNTCGRWCCVRSIFRELSMSQFNSLFNEERIDGDWLVSCLSILISETRGELIKMLKR